MSAGWRLDGYDEQGELGSGQQGRVVLARRATSGDLVAIKYMEAGAELPEDSEERTLLLHEARMLVSVRDDHVAQLYDVVEDPQGVALVMEAVDGVALKVILSEYGALAPEAALVVLRGSLLGLEAAHAAGVVHRDYKPANVLVREDGVSKLIDFGIAAPAGRQSMAGTPAYMAPEQWTGEAALPATDVYAATITFFECVTGVRPFRAAHRLALSAQHLTAPPPLHELPEPLRPLVARGLAKTAGERPPSAAAFLAELEAAALGAYGEDWRRRGALLLGGAAATLAGLFPLAVTGLAGGAATTALFSGGGGGTAVGTSAVSALGTGARGAVKALIGGGAKAVAGVSFVAVAAATTAVIVLTQGTSPAPAAQAPDDTVTVLPAAPGAPTAPTNPENPKTPDNPTSPNTPDNPASPAPGGPAGPANPGGPANPEDPGAPAAPGDPAGPGGPAAPGEPGGPGAPPALPGPPAPPGPDAGPGPGPGPGVPPGGGPGAPGPDAGGPPVDPGPGVPPVDPGPADPPVDPGPGDPPVEPGAGDPPVDPGPEDPPVDPGPGGEGPGDPDAEPVACAVEKLPAYAFDAVEVGEAATHTVTFPWRDCYGGTRTAPAITLRDASPAFTLTGATCTETTCAVLVRFAPKSLTKHTATLVVASEDGEDALTLALSGEAAFTCAPYTRSVNIGEHARGSGPHTVAVAYPWLPCDDESALTIEGDPAFTAALGPCPTTAPTPTCVIHVTFTATPDTPLGPHTATLVIPDDTGRLTTVRITLTATVTTPTKPTAEPLSPPELNQTIPA